MANTTEEDANACVPILLHDDAPVENVNAYGVNDVMTQAVEDAQAAMKEVQDSHSKAVRVT